METKSGKRLALGVMALAMCGCATWPQHGVDIQSPRRMRIAVLPVRNEVKIKKLSDIMTVAASTQTGESALIAQRMDGVTQEVTLDLERRLRSSYFFEVADSSAVRRAIEDLGLAGSTAPWTTAQLQSLGAALGAPLVLEVSLAGYGKIKRKWTFYLIGTGLAEGVFQGVAVGLAAGGNAWVAAGIAAEEVLQETLTWGGGGYLFNRYFTPVILEGRLVSASDGKVLWSTVTMTRRDRKGLKRYPKEERKKKELRLRLTSEKAVKELIRSLEKKAWKNVKARGQ